MKGLPPELVYVLIIAAILLFQYFMKRLVPQPEQEREPGQQAPLPEFPEETNEAMAAPSAPAVSVGHFGRRAPPRALDRPRGRRYSRKSLMGTRREMQNAVVIATILSPCRGMEPPAGAGGEGRSAGAAR